MAERGVDFCASWGIGCYRGREHRLCDQQTWTQIQVPVLPTRWLWAQSVHLCLAGVQQAVTCVWPCPTATAPVLFVTAPEP